jgi:hypothetical protein
VYEGFGFPVVLKNVPMVKVRDAWTPDVDYNALATDVLQAIAVQPGRLSGAKVRFVRHYFAMTAQQFGERFDVTHPAVLKWEKTGGDTANMSWGTEKDLRLFILDALGAKPKTLAEVYRSLVRPAPATSRRLVLDWVAVRRDFVAALGGAEGHFARLRRGSQGGRSRTSRGAPPGSGASVSRSQVCGSRNAIHEPQALGGLPPSVCSGTRHGA